MCLYFVMDDARAVTADPGLEIGRLHPSISTPTVVCELDAAQCVCLLFFVQNLGTNLVCAPWWCLSTCVPLVCKLVDSGGSNYISSCTFGSKWLLVSWTNISCHFTSSTNLFYFSGISLYYAMLSWILSRVCSCQDYLLLLSFFVTMMFTCSRLLEGIVHTWTQFHARCVLLLLIACGKEIWILNMLYFSLSPLIINYGPIVSF